MTSSSADPTEARERALRRELQRIHRAEVATARALEEIRAARSRVEELLPAAPPAPSVPPASSSTSGATRRRLGLGAAVGAVALLLVGFVGWWAFQNAPGIGVDATMPSPITDARSSAAEADGIPGREEVSSGESGGAGPGPEAESGPFDDLPPGGEGSIALLDSLWAGPSPLLEPLLAEVEETTGSSAVEEGIESLRAGEEPGVLVRDLVRSAALQLGLRRLTGEELSVDGQVLRNPCRGSSCGALLELWEDSASAWGLEPPGDDASRDLTGLAAAEAAAVLRVLRDLHGG